MLYNTARVVKYMKEQTVDYTGVKTTSKRYVKILWGNLVSILRREILYILSVISVAVGQDSGNAVAETWRADRRTDITCSNSTVNYKALIALTASKDGHKR